MKIFSGNIIDIRARRIFPGDITVIDGKIFSIQENNNEYHTWILPGFIDAHIHIESSMLTPLEFARIALKHGTIATVSDPHEIANVCGMDGIKFMIENARNAKMKIHFGAPSCVPATSFENSGASIHVDEIRELMQSEDIYYLSEMMNYPGVLNNDPYVFAKIEAAKSQGKPIDGHAPGLGGTDAVKYISAGISTDHECFTFDEALFKLEHGMKVIIREGSAAKNFEALHPLIPDYKDNLMFCSDDKHPDDLLHGHINILVQRALALGYDLFDVLQMACINPVEHYNLSVGTLRLGDPADFIIVSSAETLNVVTTIIDGVSVFDGNHVHLPQYRSGYINNFNIQDTSHIDIRVINKKIKSHQIIHAIDGALVTEKFSWKPNQSGEYLQTEVSHDVLKICVINRYYPSQAAVSWIHGFGLKKGAIASTVAHDSHNIIAVGVEDKDILKSIASLINSKGGLVCVDGEEIIELPLPIAGLMTDKNAEEIGLMYEEMTQWTKTKGCNLYSPFMTLSFMALLVIPKIKLSDLGLFDAETFSFYKQD
ncbi:MAG: adenine deaminase [Saprospiraceae bacterium]